MDYTGFNHRLAVIAQEAADVPSGASYLSSLGSPRETPVPTTKIAPMPAAQSSAAQPSATAPFIRSDQHELRIEALPGVEEEAATIAGRLLTSHEVRSVTIDRRQAAATVQLRAATSNGDDLTTLSALVDGTNTGLAATTKQITAPEILCWRDSAQQLDSYFRAPKMARGVKRWLYLAGAAVTFLFAMVGVLLPGIPTTPFLLLTSYCLLRSSRRLHDRLLRSKIFGRLLRDWHTHRGVRPGVKTKSLAIMVLVVGATVLFSGFPARALYGIVACSMIGVWCICRLRVIR